MSTFFQRPDLSMMPLHCRNEVSKRRSIALNIFLAVRTAMVEDAVDLVAGDFSTVQVGDDKEGTALLRKRSVTPGSPCHSTKKKGKLCSGITTNSLICLDRVRTTHCISSGHILPFALAPLVDVVADCVCAFHGTLFSLPALDLRSKLTGLHLATVAAS